MQIINIENLSMNEIKESVSTAQQTNEKIIFLYKRKEIPYTWFVEYPLSFEDFINTIKITIDNNITFSELYIEYLWNKLKTIGPINSLIEKQNEEKKYILEKIIPEYALFGDVKLTDTGKEKLINKIDNSYYLKKIEELFKQDKRFHGRVPQIKKAMAIACELYHPRITPELIVENFSIEKTRKLLNKGYCQLETVLLLNALDLQQIDSITSENCKLDKSRHFCNLVEKYFRTGNAKYQRAINWTCSHSQMGYDTYLELYNFLLKIKYKPTTTVDEMYVKISKYKAIREIEKIEEAYKDCGFKFENCKCELKRTETIYKKYKAEILKANDVRAVRLGYDTDCCQHLKGDGESSMMHGLLNPKAGFWVLENKNSGKILAQAEVWEENDNTLVFDNIEFANDADIDLYQEAIGKWLQETPYPTVKMGMGYNEMFYQHEDEFRYANPACPSVTPYEVYVISHEEESEAPVFKSEKSAKKALENGEVTYFDYVYCDSENIAIFMKENGIVEPYFTKGLEQERNASVVKNDYEENTELETDEEIEF